MISKKYADIVAQKGQDMEQRKILQKRWFNRLRINKKICKRTRRHSSNKNRRVLNAHY